MFKDKLKELREKEGLSQQELADKLFVSRSAVAKWENGNGIPSDVNLEAICKFFNVDEESLLDKSALKEFIKNIEISKRNMLILSFLLITCMALFCFLVGGSYHFHRVGIAFTFAYFIFKFFIQKNRITKILSIILLVVGITISLLNWFITAIPEPSSFFRIFRILYYQNSQNSLGIIFSQFSSILNIFMIVSYNSVLLFIKRTKKNPKIYE